MTAIGPVQLSHALADRYRIERELGAGGMASVYAARERTPHADYDVSADGRWFVFNSRGAANHIVVLHNVPEVTRPDGARRGDGPLTATGSAA